MNNALINQVIADIQNSCDGIDPFSREYFFEKKYAEHRSSVVLLGGPLSHRSLLSILLREGMTEKHRESIFPSVYDLGNMRTIPPELSTYEKLADELYGKGRNDTEANDAFETIQNGIHRITGKKVHKHFEISKSTTLKVIKTLHLLLKQRASSLMQLLNSPTPEMKFSMSFRDAYPYEKNKEQVWLIADLKTYLSAELSDERFEKIGRVHDALWDCMNTIFSGVEQVLFFECGSDYESMVSAYIGVTKAVEGFQFERELNNLPIDEELFTHLYGLEYAHFYAGFPQMVRAAIPLCPVTPVWKELREFANEVFPDESNGVNENSQLMPLMTVPEFALRWQKKITTLMEKAMGGSIKLRTYGQISEGAFNLMSTSHLYRGNGNGRMQDESTPVSILYVIAAFCCVWYSLKDATNFKPYWLGQNSQGGSINASNKKSCQVSTPHFNQLIDSVPEEHRHIWAFRLDWFSYALRGHRELKEKQFAFRSAVASKIYEICSMKNADCISQARADFEAYIGAFLYTEC